MLAASTHVGPCSVWCLSILLLASLFSSSLSSSRVSFVRLLFSDCCSSLACSGCRLVRRFAVGFALEGIGVFVAGCGGMLRGGRCMVSRGRRIKMACGLNDWARRIPACVCASGAEIARSTLWIFAVAHRTRLFRSPLSLPAFQNVGRDYCAGVWHGAGGGGGWVVVDQRGEPREPNSLALREEFAVVWSTSTARQCDSSISSRRRAQLSRASFGSASLPCSSSASFCHAACRAFADGALCSGADHALLGKSCAVHILGTEQRAKEASQVHMW